MSAPSFSLLIAACCSIRRRQAEASSKRPSRRCFIRQLGEISYVSDVLAGLVQRFELPVHAPPFLPVAAKAVA